MVKNCSIPNCKKRFYRVYKRKKTVGEKTFSIKEKGEEIPFHRFPANKERRELWVRACMKNGSLPDNLNAARICGRHFKSGKQVDISGHPSYVPTIFKDYDNEQNNTNTSSVDRYNRLFQRRRQKFLENQNTINDESTINTKTSDKSDSSDVELSENNLSEHELSEHELSEHELSEHELSENEFSEIAGSETSNSSNETIDHENDLEPLLEDLSLTESQAIPANQVTNHSTACQTDDSIQIDFSLDSSISSSEIKNLQAEVDYYKWDWNFFDSDFKINFYTGLPNAAALRALYNINAPYIESTLTTKLSKFQQMIMTLMRLRLGLLEQDLAYRFRVHQSTVSRIFKRWIGTMARRMSFLVRWPEREELYKTMPTCFRESFRKCAVIIDCFEIFIEKPSELVTRASTYSQYKKHNTIKVLIGITPQGTVSFISEPWGGRVSDVYLTENSGLLSRLEPGDVVLADRGFTLQESAALYRAEIVIPAFTKGKSQLSMKEVDTSRSISRVRIHVERVIGLLRNKYTYLQRVLAINTVMNDVNDYSQITDIVLVCSALCNICPSIIPKD
ncbi:uncharacterized protein [Clytia hemisphaerica]|uniref:uncharacterized protein n=1 Tax=Clytia hemisphaerica TaxID=252671 RepID=UPI0034D3E8F6